jgi:hypothetical protein
MPNKPVALVTGANQGIGLQIAKDLGSHGFTVRVGARTFEKGQTAAKSIGADAHAVQLDATDHKSIAAAAEFPLATPKRTSMDIQARRRSRKAPARLCALHCSDRTAQQASSRVGKTKRSRGDVVSIV